MIKSFSERQGIISAITLNPKEITVELRNRLWNIIQKYIDNFQSHPDRNDVIKYIWDRFFKQDIGNLRYSPGFEDSYYYIDQIKERFYDSEWNKVYDFLEFLLSIDNYKKLDFINNVNIIFIDECAQYKIIGEMVVPLISGIEVKEVQSAIENKYALVSKHIENALEFYRKRPIADYRNSIKESISAVESLARIILDKPSATLGVLAEQLDVHPSFKKAIKELYGWTSDEGGIRHSGNGKELSIDEKEARFMLVQCSALINYIISKNS